MLYSRSLSLDVVQSRLWLGGVLAANFASFVLLTGGEGRGLPEQDGAPLRDRGTPARWP